MYKNKKTPQNNPSSLHGNVKNGFFMILMWITYQKYVQKMGKKIP